MRKIIYAVLIFGLLGCSSIPSRTVSESGDVVRVEKPLGVSTFLKFEDVPVPAGFNLVRDQSFIYQDNALRVGLLRYAGRANSSQITSFFKAQMPLYNWDIINVVEFGNTTMNFVKSDEDCIITIAPLTTKSLINIVICPKSGTLSSGFGSGSKR
ncbi:MAG: hypothetical protein PHO42_01345 [Candidatus Omnitrophica bacterium]|nr:hypothetical protein [Candidatus Omnitrophota bacterium]